ncbi:MAG: NAD(P)-binding domain-containing protein [Acidobacteria bacterium]|nr:NAD(P)-binding domain-containing protein [Acidobacteriota bacterium]
MKRTQLIIAALFLLVLLGIGMATTVSPGFGAVPPAGWAGALCLVLFTGLALVVVDTRRSRGKVLAAISRASLKTAPPDKGAAGLSESVIVNPVGPSYPHPVINVATCIGCHACVDACPHDVLAIVNGKATPIAIEQCMEDTSCQVECPTVPKSCIVVNSTKKIPERKVPQRDQKFLTNVPGIYLIGDVSGVPLIKNAINEGGAVIDHIVEDLKKSPGGSADYDVAVIGIGPAGLSATAIAKQRGLKYIAIEQDQIVATIQQTYQAGKYVYFNPADQSVKGGIRLDGPGSAKETMIESWMSTVSSNGLVINEFESCKKISREGDHFVVETQQERTRQLVKYTARRVILAIGNRGTPMRLNVRGEDLRMPVESAPTVANQFCSQCGAGRVSENKFCIECGARFAEKTAPPPSEDLKVKFKLTDPNDYSGKHLIVVGAGNSAVEAAIDLAALRSEDGARIVGWRDNVVTLVIRSNFKSDLKLGNKMLAYECIDEGKINACFGQTIKEIKSDEVLLMKASERDPATAREIARVKNDYVFALIGGEKPTKFLESLGIRIG